MKNPTTDRYVKAVRELQEALHAPPGCTKMQITFEQGYAKVEFTSIRLLRGDEVAEIHDAVVELEVIGGRPHE